MRFAGLTLLAIILIVPVLAHADGVNFGNANCEGTVSCSPDGASIPAIAANAKACSDMHFGPRGFSFDPTSMDGNCLQAVATSHSSSQGLTMTPHCCVVQSDNTCHVQCQLMGTH